MMFIAHRGHISGIQPDLENNPTYLKMAIQMGYAVETDVWYMNGRFMLGHDEPIFEVQRSFLEQKEVWCHAKNAEALDQLLTPFACHVFWHENDRMTITSRGFIWHFPTNHDFNHRSICVLPEVGYEFGDKIPKICYAICSDHIQKYKHDYESLNPIYYNEK